MPHATTLRKQPNGKFEVEFTAGVWTDVTTDVDQAAQLPTIRYGRSSEFSTPQTAELTVTLRNFDRDASGAPLFDANHNYVRGNYTPQDSTSPYYPNIQPRKRIRYSYNPGSQRMRFLGYIKAWQPLISGGIPYMQITAATRDDQLSRVTMLSPIMQELTVDDPSLWWPLTDPAGSTQGIEQSGNMGPPICTFGPNPALTFGDNGPGFGDGSGVKMAGGQYLSTGITFPFGVGLVFSHEIWAQTSSATDGVILSFTDTTGAGAFVLDIKIAGASTGKASLSGAILTTLTSGSSVVDGGWHHYAVTCDGTNVIFYLDGASVGTTTVSGMGGPPNAIRVGQADPGSTSAPFTGNVGQVALYPVVLSSTRVAVHAAAGKGYYGDTTDARIARWLGLAGLTASDWTLDVGQTTVNSYPQAGRDVLSACQDMAATEGGGAVFYTTPDGKVRFANRRYRDSLTPKLTINAVDDLDPSVYSPSFDDLNLVTQATVTRSAESGGLTTQTYTNTTAVTAFGVFADQPTTYTTSDTDALGLAQYEVNSHATPLLRFPQIAVDLATAGHNLYDAVGQLQIGDRIRLTNIPSVAYPTSSLDFFLEGWTETPGVDSYQVVFDVTAADNPGPRFQLDVSTLDGPAVLAF